MLTAIDEQSGDIAWASISPSSSRRARRATAGERRRRPGHDVRLRLRRDAGADAPAPVPGTEAVQAHGGGPQERPGAYMRPDGKSQVTVEYDEHNRPVRVDTVVISTQHSPEVSLDQIRLVCSMQW